MPINDFVMVIPPGWTEIANGTSIIEGWGEAGIVDSIQQQNWGDVGSMLEAAGVLPTGQDVTDARLFSTGETGANRLRLWVVLSPSP